MIIHGPIIFIGDLIRVIFKIDFLNVTVCFERSPRVICTLVLTCKLVFYKVKNGKYIILNSTNSFTLVKIM